MRKYSQVLRHRNRSVIATSQASQHILEVSRSVELLRWSGGCSLLSQRVCGIKAVQCLSGELHYTVGSRVGRFARFWCVEFKYKIRTELAIKCGFSQL